MDCLFCKIAQGEIASESLYEDERVRAFRDLHPKAPVHILMVPKKHIASVADLAPDDATLVGQLVLAAKLVAKQEGLPGYKLVVNVGRDGGQVIDHLHLHLLGGWLKGEVSSL